MDGNGDAVTLNQISMSSGEIREVNVQPLLNAAAARDDLDSVSVQINNDGPAGSLIGALYSKDQNSGVSFDIPLRDSGRMRNSTGGYPWRLDDDFRTVVTLTNTGDEPVQFVATIFYPGGDYSFMPRTLGPGKTAKYSLKKMRDEATPDAFGETLPISATAGQFKWSIIRPADSDRLIGRSEVVSESNRVSSSYSCGLSCPASGPYYNPNAPYQPILAAGQLMGSNLVEVWQYASGVGGTSTYPGTYPGLYIANSGIAEASMAQAGLIETEGIAPGNSTWFSGGYNQWHWFDAGYDCFYNVQEMEDSGSVVVLTVGITKADGSALPSPFRIGINATTIGGDTHNSSSHLHDRKQSLKATVEPASQAANITIAGSSSLTISNVQRTGGIITFDVVGNTKSSNAGDASITAKRGNVPITTKSVSVVVPAKIATPHDTTGVYSASNRALDATTLPAVQGVPAGKVLLASVYVRYLDITVHDQFGSTIGDVYAGAQIAEVLSGITYGFYDNLSASSKYLDPTGFAREGDTVDAGSAAATTWYSQSLIPLSGTTKVQNIPVKVDGFLLDPSIVNRTVVSTPPNTVTITWPNSN